MKRIDSDPTGNLQLFVTFQKPVNLTLFEVPVIWKKYLFVFLLLARSFGIFYTKFMKAYSDYQRIGTFKQTNQCQILGNPNLLGQLLQSATVNFTYSLVHSAKSWNASTLSAFSVIS